LVFFGVLDGQFLMCYSDYGKSKFLSYIIDGIDQAYRERQAPGRNNIKDALPDEIRQQMEGLLNDEK
jgi:hypothetical protein